LKIRQYLTKLCVDYVGLLFLAHALRLGAEGEGEERIACELVNSKVQGRDPKNYCL